MASLEKEARRAELADQCGRDYMKANIRNVQNKRGEVGSNTYKQLLLTHHS